MASTPMTPMTDATQDSDQALPTSTPSTPPSDRPRRDGRASVGASSHASPSVAAVSQAMFDEEKRMEAAALREEGERNKRFQEQRERDLKGGDEVVDPKFKRLEYLLGQSKIYSSVLMAKMEQQREAARRAESASHSTTPTEATEPREPTGQAKATAKRQTRSAATSTGPTEEASSVRSAGRQTGKRSKAMPTRAKSKEKAGQSDITAYFDQGKLSGKAGASVAEALDEAADEHQIRPEAFGAQVSRSARQPDLVSGGVMRGYQLEGLEWLISLYENGLNGILADEMGLGKTVQTIAFLAFLRSKGTYGPFLVAAPLSTLSNWVDEFNRWTPTIPVVLYHGSKDEREQLRDSRLKGRPSREFPVVCTSYEICMNDRKYLANMGWKFIIIDEGHRLKNLNCRLMRELKSYDSANRLLITGTPLQNNLAELWSLLNFLMPDIFDQLESFESWFDFSALQERDGHRQILVGQRRGNIVASLHAILKPFLLRRVKAEVETALPKKREYILYAPLSTSQKDLYRHIVDGSSREYLQARVVERLTAEEGQATATGRGGKKRKSGSGTATPNKSARSSRASTPGSRGRSLRGVKRRDYREAGDNDSFEAQASDEQVDELDEDELEAMRRAKTMALAKKEIGNKKLQNPVMQLRLACNSPHNFYWPWADEAEPDESLVTESGKMMLLDRLVPALFDKGHKVLIFSQFKTQLDMLEDWARLMRGWEVCRIDGQVKQEERQAQIKAFNSDPACRIFLLSTRAGGQGINLTAADTVILFDSDWNPQQDLQAQDRAHRIGQKRPVIVYRLATRGTVEQTLLEKADGKRRLEKLVMQKGKFRSLYAKSALSGDGDDEADELHRLLTEDDFEQYDVDEGGGARTKGRREILSQHDLDILTDRSEEAYARAAKGLDGGDGFRLVESKKKGDDGDGGDVLAAMSK